MKSDNEKLIQEAISRIMEKEITTVVCNPIATIEVTFDESNRHLAEEILSHLQRMRGDIHNLASQTFKTICQIQGSSENLKFSFELNKGFDFDKEN